MKNVNLVNINIDFIQLQAANKSSSTKLKSDILELLRKGRGKKKIKNPRVRNNKKIQENRNLQDRSRKLTPSINQILTC